MKLEKIFIRNFRSVGEKGLELTFTPTLNTFIGENNVGKSSIFEAIRKSLEPNIGWDAEEWHVGDKDKTVEIQIVCTLDYNQINQIIGFLGLSLTETDFRENFTDKMTYVFKSKANSPNILFKLGELQIDHSTGWIGETDPARGYVPINKDQINEKIKFQKNKKPILIIKQLLTMHQQGDSSQKRIDFGRNVSEDLLKLLKQSIIIIEEFREKPQKNLSDIWTSPNGRELASVLFNLSTSRPKEKKKFEQIQKNFHQLFPSLELDVIREYNEIKILIQKAGIESTTFYLGAGILETLLLLTHSIAHDDKVLCVDHPELHLHPTRKGA